MRARSLAPLLALAAAGCMSTARVRPDADGWRSGVRTVAIMPAIRIYEVSAGEVREQRDDWSAESTRSVAKALSAGLAERGFTPRLLDPKAEKSDPELREVRLLYEEVGDSVFLLAYPPFASEHVLKHFEYEVGPLDRVLGRARADALLVAYGRSDVSTTGRRVTRALFGGRPELNLLTLGLLDRKGHLVWFDVAGNGFVDLRDGEMVARLAQGMLQQLPGEAQR
ncbi:MAG TPA: hypothetical protein VF805_04355 [Anaeromyxobacteraceae bacterium]